MTNTGRKEPTNVYQCYCLQCEKSILPRVLGKTKFGKRQNLIDLISRWDEIEMPFTLIDVVGCFIYSNEKVHAGEQRFLKKRKENKRKRTQAD